MSYKLILGLRYFNVVTKFSVATKPWARLINTLLYD